jgi:hypothetical protein
MKMESHSTFDPPEGLSTTHKRLSVLALKALDLAHQGKAQSAAER